MPFPRTFKRPIDEYKELLRIDWDWSSTGIWVIKEPKQEYAGSNLDYDALSLPEWLIERFRYWTDWLEASEPWNGHEKQDAELLAAYQLSLGVDLKRVLGDDYYVECSGREIHDDLLYMKRVNTK